MEISRVEMSDCSSSPALGGAAGSAGLAAAPADVSRRARMSAFLISCPPRRHDAVELGWGQQEIEQETDGNGEHYDRKQGAQLLGAELLPGSYPELPANDAAGGEDERKHDVEGLRKTGVEDAHQGGDEDDLKDRRADHDVGRHAQEVDHRRHHDEAAAHAEKGGEQADHRADHERGNGADIKTRARKAELERQPMNPIVLSGTPRRRRLADAGALQRAEALAQHQRADHAEQNDVGQRDDEAGLSRLAQEFEQEERKSVVYGKR